MARILGGMSSTFPKTPFAAKHPLAYALTALAASLLALGALDAFTENVLAPTTGAAFVAFVFYVAGGGTRLANSSHPARRAKGGEVCVVSPSSDTQDSKGAGEYIASPNHSAQEQKHSRGILAAATLVASCLGAAAFVLAGGLGGEIAGAAGSATASGLGGATAGGLGGEAAGAGNASVILLGAPIASSLVTGGVLVQLCLLTAVFEETLFRGVLYGCFSRAAKTPDAPPEAAQRKALVAQALIFAVLHVTAFSPEGALPLVAQVGVLALRFSAAFLFALIMAQLLGGRMGIGLPILVHFLYDFVLFAPLAWEQGIVRENILTGGMPDVVSIAIQVVVLVVVVLAWMRRESCYHTPSEL